MPNNNRKALNTHWEEDAFFTFNKAWVNSAINEDVNISSNENFSSDRWNNIYQMITKRISSRSDISDSMKVIIDSISILKRTGMNRADHFYFSTGFPAQHLAVVYLFCNFAAITITLLQGEYLMNE